ncbi:hypothetical protein ACO2Q1_11155 [Brevundimonas sp. VNH65]|uniref:GT-D fold domain-containing protein n=1 Tax=Brevundimonas sp. VNH65 TaxID=3400917 RepID=UPI003C0D52B0
MNAAEPRVRADAVLRDQFKAYFRRRPIAELRLDLQILEKAAHRADLSPAGCELASSEIRAAIEGARPFSLVRIGDGEGNVLAADDPDFPELSRSCAGEIMRMMFGYGAILPTSVMRVRQGLIEAIQEADILGVSDSHRLDLMEARLAQPETISDLRGLHGSAESIVRVKNILLAARDNRVLAVTNHIHRFLASDYATILSELDYIAYVAPYDLDAALSRRFGAPQVIGFRIPNQASNWIGVADRWYGSRFEQLIQDMRVPEGRGVFLVGAGLLGKAICTAVKRKGGVALDIGSMIDVWAGHSVRRYHDEAFLRQHALVANVTA